MSSLKSPGSLRVLVVEDNPVNQRLVAAFLEEAGHAPVLAAGGREALVVLERESFDLILMDIQMPGMDGFQTTAAIRAGEGPARPRIPILATTANANREDRERCLAAGMDGYLSKPIRYEELVALVESMIFGDRKLRPDPGPPDGGTGRRSGREMTPLFVEDAIRLHAQMREAIARQDGAALQHAAHTLCGTAGFFHAQTVLDLARRLEALGKAGDFGTEAHRAFEELGEELDRLGRELRGDGL